MPRLPLMTAAAALLQVLIGLEGAAMAEMVAVPVPSPYSYDDASVRPIVLSGRRDRYLEFVGHTVIEWPAIPARLNQGNPGTVRCEPHGRDARGGDPLLFHLSPRLSGPHL